MTMNLKNFATSTKSTASIYMVKPEDINVRPGWNARLDGTVEREAHIEHLMRLIAANGFDHTKPIIVSMEDDKLWIEEGHNRKEAIDRLNRDAPGSYVAIPCQAVPVGESKRDRKLRQLTSQVSLDLSGYEKAIHFKDMIAMGMSHDDIARAAGFKSVKQVENLLHLASATPEVVEMIAKDQISATSVIEMIKSQGAEKAMETATAAVTDAVSQGKTKATKKTMTQKPTNFVSDLLGLTVPVAPAVQATPAGIPELNYFPEPEESQEDKDIKATKVTKAGYEMMIRAMFDVVDAECNDLELAKAHCQECLHQLGLRIIPGRNGGYSFT